MDMTINQQVALDESLVPYASRLRIGESNFCLRSDITSKELTIQVVYDVLRLTPFYKVFLTFNELPFEEEILAFLRYLGHIREIKKIINEDFVYQVEHKDAKKSNEMYYPRFTKVIMNFFMTKDPLIPRRNKVNWHYVRDDQMFTTIKLVSRHQNTQQFGAMFPVKLTIEDIRNSSAYKEYYAIAPGEAPPKTKSNMRKTQSCFDTTLPPLMATGTRLSTSTKGKQPAKSSKAKKSSDKDDDDVDDQSDDDDDNDDDQDSENDSDDFVHPKLSTHDEEAKDEESFDPIGSKGSDAEDDDEELYRDININLEGRDVQMIDVHTTQVLEDTHVILTLVNPDGQQQSSSVSSQFVTSMFNLSPDVGIDSLFESTPRVDVPVMTTVMPLLVTAPTLPPPSIPIMSQVQQALAPTPTTALSTSLQDLLNFGSLIGFDHHLKTLEANFSEFMQTNQFAEAVSSIPGQGISLEKTVNEHIEAKVFTRASYSSKTSYAMAANLSELELKKILIEKIESNKSIHRSDEQRNLYKTLVDAYECDKIILDTYGDTVTLKRHRDDEDKDEEPSAGSDRGTARESAPAEERIQTTQDLEKPSHQEFETDDADDQPVAEASQHPEYDLAKQADSRASFNELMDTPIDFSAFLINRLNVDTLTPELLAGPTYALMKGSCKSLVEHEFFLKEVYKATTDQLDWNNHKGQQYPYNLLKPLPLIPNSRGHHVIPFDHFINNDLEYLRGGASNRKYTTSVIKIKATDYGHIKWIEDLPRTMESARDVYSKHRIIAVTKLQIVEWHNYKHLDWITVRRDDDKLYKFKEECFAFNVSLRMFTRSIVIQRRVEDLQLGVKSYQKKLNLTKPDTYRFDLKCKEAYTAYSNLKGFIYQNKDKQNRLMRIDELHKFSDSTLDDV
nr:hypothetical protein [Tanacetum cinerariifolium]